MLTIGVDLVAQSVSALPSDVVFGPPSPVAIMQFVRALLLEADPSLDTRPSPVVTIGLRSWVVDAPPSRRKDAWSPIRHSFNFTTGAEGGQASALAIVDDPRGNVTFSLVVSIDADSGRAEVIAHEVADALPGMKFAGGVLVPSQCRVVALGNSAEFLRGAYIMCDRTQTIQDIAAEHGRDSMDVLLDICHRPSESAPIDDYEARLRGLGYVCPTPIGYRTLSAFSARRRGRRCDMPHAYVESVTGLVEYRPAWRMKPEELPLEAWRSGCNQQLVYFVERVHG